MKYIAERRASSILHLGYFSGIQNELKTWNTEEFHELMAYHGPSFWKCHGQAEAGI